MNTIHWIVPINISAAHIMWVALASENVVPENQSRSNVLGGQWCLSRFTTTRLRLEKVQKDRNCSEKCRKISLQHILCEQHSPRRTFVPAFIFRNNVLRGQWCLSSTTYNSVRTLIPLVGLDTKKNPKDIENCVGHLTAFQEKFPTFSPWSSSFVFSECQPGWGGRWLAPQIWRRP